MDVTKSIYPALPRWVAGVYGLLALITIPWTLYLAVTLPTRHLSRHWDISWVGLDLAIVLMLSLNTLFSYFESKWLVMSATATTTLLLTDAWFDVMSARAGRPFMEALVLALLIELPLALLTFSVALKIVRREPPVSQLKHPADSD
jgi:hypothetical protein